MSTTIENLAKGIRTGIDFSKHELLITKSEFHTTHFLKIPGSSKDCIRYTNIDGVLVVTGDYGNWIFCRAFEPSPEGHVSEGYWHEKLRNSSTQDGREFDSEATRASIEEMINGGAVQYGYEGEKLKEYLEYLEGCLRYVDCSEHEYTSNAYLECPSFIDAESVIMVKSTKYWLKAVFDGFEEICRRLKEGLMGRLDTGKAIVISHNGYYHLCRKCEDRYFIGFIEHRLNIPQITEVSEKFVCEKEERTSKDWTHDGMELTPYTPEQISTFEALSLKKLIEISQREKL